MATFLASVATNIASAATIIAGSALKIIVTGSAGSVIRKAAASIMKPPPRVPYHIRVSTQYLNALALGIYNLSVKNQKIFTASALFSYVSENRSEEHTSELQSLMRISYAVFCLKKKTKLKT